MSDCRCSGAGREWSDHSDYCPVFMQGRIRELEAENAQLQDHLDHSQLEEAVFNKAEGKVARVEALPGAFEKTASMISIETEYLQGTIAGYRRCAEELRAALEPEHE